MEEPHGGARDGPEHVVVEPRGRAHGHREEHEGTEEGDDDQGHDHACKGNNVLSRIIGGFEPYLIENKVHVPNTQLHIKGAARVLCCLDYRVINLSPSMGTTVLPQF